MLDCCSDVIYNYDGQQWSICCDLKPAMFNFLNPFNANKITAHAVDTGKNTLASGEYAIAEGDSTIASGYASHAGGILSIAPLDGSWARAIGGFNGLVGSCQYSLYHLGLETKSTTANQIFSTVSNNNHLIIPTNTAWTVDVSIIGADPTFTLYTSCKIVGLVINNNGTITMPSNSNTTVISGTAGVPTIIPNNVNKTMQIIVTPTSSTTIRWNATIQITNISF